MVKPCVKTRIGRKKGSERSGGTILFSDGRPIVGFVYASKCQNSKEVQMLTARGEVVAVNRLALWERLSSKPIKIHIKTVNVHPDRLSRENRLWRKEVLKRDESMCISCGEKKQLEVHHILHFKSYPSKRFSVSNGVTLCRECHKRQHKPF